MKHMAIFLLVTVLTLNAQALFEVKDASDNSVFEITDDGIRIFSYPDTLMIINSAEVRVNLDNSKNKGLSRSFSISTNTTGKAGLANVLEVGTESTQMREGSLGEQYTNFSPENIFIGLNTGVNTVVNEPLGASNVFLGNNAGVSNVSGGVNVFIGDEAGYLNVSNHNNTFIGAGAGYSNVADDNIYIGNSSGYYSQTGASNVFIGTRAGASNNTGSSNVFIGTSAGYGDQYFSMGTSTNNVCVGDSSSMKNLYGRQNTSIGSKSGFNNSSGVGNVFIGYQSGYNETSSNKLYIDNSNTSTPLIYGEFDNDIVKITGTLGIGSTLVSQLYSNDATASNDDPAIYGRHFVTDYYGVGVRGDGKYQGVMGYADSGSDEAMGVYGIATGSGTGVRYGVYGNASGGETAWAGYFAGNANVTGTLSKGGGSFKIDHPLDPENKYLYHSFVESPDMKNIYDGVVKLDNNGEGVVELPEWFEALNDNFRYQLTPIGAPGPSLYIAQEISNNKFKIAGGKSSMKVSWMVTGIRIDKFAEANRIPIEEDKAKEDKGYYLHPESFGKSVNKGIDEKNRKKEIK